MTTRPLKWCLIQPPPGVEIAPSLLRLAADALEAPLDEGLNAKARRLAQARRLAVAHAYARAVDWTAFDWFWLEGGLEWERRDRALGQVYEGLKAAPSVPADMKRAVIMRDGWRCRYCRLAVISSAAMTALERRLPAALPIGPTAFECHRMQCVLRLTWDHVVPRSHGGGNDAANIVVSCGGCNYNKGSSTLDELGLRHPDERSILSDDWDGLNGRLGSRPVIQLQT
jgi:5-methylcytosine-specific restriction endonuclease McrA